MQGAGPVPEALGVRPHSLRGSRKQAGCVQLDSWANISSSSSCLKQRLLRAVGRGSPRCIRLQL